MRSSRYSGRVCAVYVAVLCLIVSAFAMSHAQQAIPEESASFLDKLNTLIDYDLAIGYSDNPYLWPSNRFADALINVVATTETRREIGRSSTVYISSYFEQKMFATEQVANELLANLLLEFGYSIGAFKLRLSDLVLYEDYRIADDIDVVDSPGDYRSWSDKVRFTVDWSRGRHDLDTSVDYRINMYQDMDFDFGEIGFLLRHHYRFTDSMTTRFSVAFRQKIYRDLQAAGADGIVAMDGPLLSMDRYEVKLRLRKNGAKGGHAEIRAGYTANLDTFDDQDSHGQISLSGSASFQMGLKYAASASVDVWWRDYAERTVDAAGTVQSDNFVSCELILERIIYKVLSGYVGYELAVRDSNFDPYDYVENVVTLGVKHML